MSEKKLRLNRLEHMQHAVLQYRAQVEVDTTLDDILSPAFWSGVAFKAKIGTKIEVVSDDMKLDVDLRVVSVIKDKDSTTPSGLIVEPLRIGRIAVARKLDSSDDVTVEWGGKNERFRVLHGKKIVGKNFDSEEEANTRAEEIRKTIKNAATAAATV